MLGQLTIRDINPCWFLLSIYSSARPIIDQFAQCPFLALLATLQRMFSKFTPLQLLPDALPHAQPYFERLVNQNGLRSHGLMAWLVRWLVVSVMTFACIYVYSTTQV